MIAEVNELLGLEVDAEIVNALIELVEAE